MITKRPPTDQGAEVRAELARRRLPIYQLAALVRVHPLRLGKMINGRVTLTPEIARRIREALDGAGERSA